MNEYDQCEYHFVDVIIAHLCCTSAELEVTACRASSFSAGRISVNEWRWQWNASQATHNQLWRRCIACSVSSATLLNYQPWQNNVVFFYIDEVNFLCCRHFRSTPKSRPNNLYMGLRWPSARTYVRMYVRPSVRPSKNSFSDSDEIWYVGRGRWVMHHGMPYDPIQGQGQGHETFKVRNSSIFLIYLRHF